MSERIDHAALAAVTIANMRANESPTDQNEVLAMAQVHASLALVEQQRIANLIALGEERVAKLEPYDFTSPTPELRPEIREALGL